MTQVCTICGDELKRPLPKNANYVTSDRFVEPEKVEVTYAMHHTGETLAKLDQIDEKIPNRDRQALAAEAANPEAPQTKEIEDGTDVEYREGGRVETVQYKEIDFSIDAELFDHVRVDSPSAVKEDDVATVYTIFQEEDVKKTATLCSDCTEDSDEIIWGVDA